MSNTPMRQRLLLILAALVVVFAATHLHLQPRATSKADDVKLLAISASGVYWVNQLKDGPATLWRAPRVGQTGQQIAAAADLRSLAAAGKDLFYLTEDKQPDSGQLWRVRAGGGAPQSLLPGLRSPQALLATGGQLYWTETRPSPAPGLACVPVLQPLSLIMRANLDGQGRALLSVSESAEAHFTGKFLGVRSGQFYWLQHFGQQYSRPTTMISRVPLQGGPATQLAREDGRQDAVLAGRALYWTAPSEEMSPALSGRTVRCVPLSGGDPRTLTDWLTPDGSLLLVGQRPYYCDQTYLWRIPARLGEARPVAQPKLDPNCLATYGDTVYGRVKSSDGSHLGRLPLTVGARLRGLIGP